MYRCPRSEQSGVRLNGTNFYPPNFPRDRCETFRLFAQRLRYHYNGVEIIRRDARHVPSYY